MTDETIFNGEPAPAAKPDVQPKQEPTAPVEPQANQELDQLLAGIVTEDGRQKYKSVQDALKALTHAQQHIKTLEEDNKDLAELVAKVNAQEQLLNELKEGGGDKSPTVDLSTVVPELVMNTLTGIEKQKARQTNTAVVADAFVAEFGKEAEKVFYERAASLGFNKAEINEMAAQKPNATLKLLDIKEKSSPPRQPSGMPGDLLQTKPAPEPKSAMGFGSTKDLLEAWRTSKARTAERLGIKN